MRQIGFRGLIIVNGDERACAFEGDALTIENLELDEARALLARLEDAPASGEAPPRKGPGRPKKDALRKPGGVLLADHLKKGEVTREEPRELGRDVDVDGTAE